MHVNSMLYLLCLSISTTMVVPAGALMLFECTNNNCFSSDSSRNIKESEKRTFEEPHAIGHDPNNGASITTPNIATGIASDSELDFSAGQETIDRNVLPV